MTEPPSEAQGTDVTRLLASWRGGDQAALEELVPLVYDELRVLAQRQLTKERDGHTLSATALVHEAYLNLAAGAAPSLNDRVHFFAIASRVMRRVLVWHARRRNAAKRGGGVIAVTLDEAAVVDAGTADEILALDEALAALEKLDPRLCQVVDCRHFGGLTVPETARALGVSAATVKRDWTTARAWLRARMEDEGV